MGTDLIALVCGLCIINVYVQCVKVHMRKMCKNDIIDLFMPQSLVSSEVIFFSSRVQV